MSNVKLDMRPIGCGVIVQVQPAKEATHGKIVLVENDRRYARVEYGEILAMGPSAFVWLDEEHINFKVGDIVGYPKSSGLILSELGYDTAGLNGEPEIKLINDEDLRVVKTPEGE